MKAKVKQLDTQGGRRHRLSSQKQFWGYFSWEFVDFEKAFNRVPREVIAWAFRRQMVLERLIKLLMALYENSASKVKAPTGISEKFSIRVGVQGSALSPLQFIVVVQETVKEARREGLKELLYADDLVIKV